MFEKLKNEFIIKEYIEEFNRIILERIVRNNIQTVKEEPKLRPCIFCDYPEDFRKAFGVQVNVAAEILSTELVRKIYQIEKKKELSISQDYSHCLLHDDYWLTIHSNMVSGFISYAIIDNDILDVDYRHPKEVIDLLSDFDTMDFVLHRNYEKKKEFYEKQMQERFSFGYMGKIKENEIKHLCFVEQAWDYFFPKIMMPNSLLYRLISKYDDSLMSVYYSLVSAAIIDYKIYSNLDYYYDFSKHVIRNVGKKWLDSLDPKNFDGGYYKHIEEYGPWSRDRGIISTRESREWKKIQLEKWLEKAERELGKKFIHSKTMYALNK